MAEMEMEEEVNMVPPLQIGTIRFIYRYLIHNNDDKLWDDGDNDKWSPHPKEETVISSSSSSSFLGQYLKNLYTTIVASTTFPSSS